MHLAFGEKQNKDLTKKMSEAYINEVLTCNASLAGRGSLKSLTKYMDNNKRLEKSFNNDRKENSDESDKTDQKSKGFSHRQVLGSIRIKVGNLKLSYGDQICSSFNT